MVGRILDIKQMLRNATYRLERHEQREAQDFDQVIHALTKLENKVSRMVNDASSKTTMKTVAQMKKILLESDNEEAKSEIYNIRNVILALFDLDTKMSSIEQVIEQVSILTCISCIYF